VAAVSEGPYTIGFTHAEIQAPASSLQSKVLPASVDVYENVAVLLLVATGGAFVMVVSGAVVSAITQLHVAGEASALPAASTAKTEKL
jgi:hypothetical protein